MRPFVLDPLFRAVSTLPGVGPKSVKLYEKLTGGTKILDLLFHKPIDLVERIEADSIMEAPVGATVQLKLIVDHHTPAPRRGQPYRIRCLDKSGFIDLVFFSAYGTYLEKQYPVQGTVIISGKVEEFRGQKQIVHPDMLGHSGSDEPPEKFEIIYPLTAGLTTKMLRKSMLAAFPMIPLMPEWQDAAYKKKMGWGDFKESLTKLHHPASSHDLEASALERQRLAYDELLSNQLALSLMRNRQRKMNGRKFTINGPMRKKLNGNLPFQLTKAQTEVIKEIDADMALPSRMLRLLQGDVGSGKTIVAAIAMMNAIDSGTQAAIMAPTEILARQHAESFAPLLDPLGIRCVTLTGRDKGKTRDSLLAEIADGRAQIIIGTHALFQDTVEFHDLGLAVIDEQHRFGVHQRLQLSSKSKGTDVLVMTATPIPRTLALTAYGDMEVSRITEKPPGRKPVDTRLIPQDKIDDMIDGIARQIKDGVRAYWVCPLVEESEILDLAAAEKRYDILKQRFGDKVGLIHGRMKPTEKDQVMEKFIAGDISILVATTVIEVGVNVPAASIMIIEHAERFGLAQLHQLRGRVGRGEKQSYCFLVYVSPLGETAKERLSIMRQTEDGFVIAEKDMQLRGTGEILGTRQSGLPEFSLADLGAHSDLLLTARDDANLIIDRDPELKSERGGALRILLYLFEQDQAITYLRSG
jgi:ATP-dependent DNA helicase RecG